jgi:cytochrome b6-f complex iron-sulfur subunit
LPKKSPKHLERERARKIEETKIAARGKARQSLNKLQFLSGIFLLLSAVVGIYLLATDNSLWILAVSHAYGLVAIVGIDLIFGILSLVMMRRVFLWSVAGALLGVLLQIGDIVTAPQYGMTIQYFASYLFGLWAFDALLVAQVLVVFFGLFSRVHIRTLTEAGRYRTKFSASRRDFLRSMIVFAGVVAVTAAFSLIGQSRASLPTATTTGLPAGAVANTSRVQSGSPVYFDYPSGYPNILLKKNDGSFIALSMLCTHVCCQLTYDSNGNQLYCQCHGSLFDLNGNVVQGPAVIPLPNVQITIDNNGNVFPQSVIGSNPCSQG